MPDDTLEQAKESRSAVESIEVVFTTGFESSLVTFCSELECPDYEKGTCWAEFTGTAWDRSKKVLSDDNAFGYHLIVDGHVLTGSEYGHLGGYDCQLFIENVWTVEAMNHPMLRSNELPLLTKEPEP